MGIYHGSGHGQTCPAPRSTDSARSGFRRFQNRGYPGDIPRLRLAACRLAVVTSSLSRRPGCESSTRGPGSCEPRIRQSHAASRRRIRGSLRVRPCVLSRRWTGPVVDCQHGRLPGRSTGSNCLPPGGSADAPVPELSGGGTTTAVIRGCPDPRARIPPRRRLST